MKNENSRLYTQLGLAAAVAFVLGLGTFDATAATFTVDTVSDVATLTSCTSSANDCSLRGAIANANGSIDDDTIHFVSSLAGQTITLGGTELSIEDNGGLTIKGPDSGRPIVSANDKSRVFEVKKGAVLAIEGITVTGGFNKMGSGVFSVGSLTLTNTVVERNNVGESGRKLGNQFGGGIFSQGGSLTLVESIVRNNVADFGGGIVIMGAALTIIDSTISGNAAEGPGGISFFEDQDNDSETGATINNSTVSGNSGSFGGGIHNSGLMTLNNSTVSGNTAARKPTEEELRTNTGKKYGGGGVYNEGDSLKINGSTITNNKSYGKGAGIVNEKGTVSMGNTIVAGNADDNYVPDATGKFDSKGFNLIGHRHEDFGENDQADVQSAKLGELADNGGPTETHALLCGSPAIDAGKKLDDEARWDQRGVGFLRSLDDPQVRIRGDGTDIGAFELQQPCDVDSFNRGKQSFAKEFVVDNTGDDGSLSVCTTAANDCSLRGAISAAKALLGADRISFDPSLENQTITLSGEYLEIDDSGTVTIDGPGADKLSISGNNGSRVFFIDQLSYVVIKGVRLTGGNAGDGSGYDHLTSGGAVYNAGSLLLDDVTISGNTAITEKFLGGDGGAIYNTGTLTLNKSTVSGNKSKDSGAIANRETLVLNNSTIEDNKGGSGAGIDNYGGIVSINNSTISNNIAEGDGGGIDNSHLNEKTARGVVILNESTVSGNQAKGSRLLSGSGGGINNTGDLIMANSTISGNSATKGGGIANYVGQLVVNNSTITLNNAEARGFFGRIGGALGSGSGGGGGIYNRSDGDVSIGNTIVAGNMAGDKKNPDVFGEFNSKGFNLIGNIGKSSGFGNNDVTESGKALIDPKLGPLADNGGWSKTHALLCGSPAIDAGKNLYTRSDQDQRLGNRTFDNPAVRNSGDATDIGAFEVQEQLNCN